MVGLSRPIDELYYSLSKNKKNNSLKQQDIILRKTIEEIDNLILKQKINQKQFSGETIFIPKQYKDAIKDYLNELNP